LIAQADFVHLFSSKAKARSKSDYTFAKPPLSWIEIFYINPFNGDKMKLPLLPILVFTLCCLSVPAKTINLVNYATPDDGQDDSVGFQRALNDLKDAGGGTLVVNSGDWDLSTPLDLTTYGNYVSYVIRGDKGAVIRLALRESEGAIYAGNANQVELRDLVFTGDSTVDYDTGYVYLANYTAKTIVSGCQFYGIRAKDGLFYLGNTDAVFDNVQFDGNAADHGVIHAVNFSGLTVTSTEFLDYGNFRSQYYSKSPNNAGPWINAEVLTGFVPPNALAQRVVRIQDVRFDEGASNAIKLTNISQFLASGLMVNVSGVTGSAGILLDNVGYSDIRLSAFGYTANARPAIRVTDHSTASIAGIIVGGGVFAAYKDTSSQIFYDKATCKRCFVQDEIQPTLKSGNQTFLKSRK
jgi:hypothetical protein